MSGDEKLRGLGRFIGGVARLHPWGTGIVDFLGDQFSKKYERDSNKLMDKQNDYQEQKEGKTHPYTKGTMADPRAKVWI
jgi:hypothetical protein